MPTVVPAWIQAEAAAGNARPLQVWSAGLDPTDPGQWARAITEGIVEQDPPYEPAPWPRPSE